MSLLLNLALKLIAIYPLTVGSIAAYELINAEYDISYKDGALHSVWKGDVQSKLAAQKQDRDAMGIRNNEWLLARGNEILLCQIQTESSRKVCVSHPDQFSSITYKDHLLILNDQQEITKFKEDVTLLRQALEATTL